MDIEVANASKRFGSTLALDNVTIRLAGRINLLLGSNGSGKSTLINLLAGVTYPNKGILRFDGSEYDGRSRKVWRSGTERLRKKSRFWLDKPGLPQPMTGAELLKFQSNDDSRIDHSSELKQLVQSSFGSSVDLEKPISSYSSGMQQKLGIMATLVGRPEFVVWDEPTAALDATSRRTVARLAKEYASEGTKFLIASHIPGDFEGITDWIGLMTLGQLKRSGNLSELSDSGSDSYIIITDKPSQLAGKLLEWGMASSASVEGTRVVVKATEKFEEKNVTSLAKEELGATRVELTRRQKSVGELYMETLA